MAIVLNLRKFHFSRNQGLDAGRYMLLIKNKSFMNVLDKLKELGAYSPFDSRLPTEDDITQLEYELKIVLPDSYKEYLLEYSNIYFDGFELLKPFKDNSYSDIYKVIKDAYKSHRLSERYIPFLYDNGDYYCFNLDKNSSDYEVLFCSHNGTTNEKWANFLDWVEKCWIGENA